MYLTLTFNGLVVSVLAAKQETEFKMVLGCRTWKQFHHNTGLSSFSFIEAMMTR